MYSRADNVLVLGVTVLLVLVLVLGTTMAVISPAQAEYQGKKERQDPNGGGGGGGGAAAPLELTQETEQEAESGDIDQSVEVVQEGDNSTQCANVQPVANTGNTQNVTDVLQVNSETDDWEFEEVGSDITVSPTNTITCDQQVNQAASASG